MQHWRLGFLVLAMFASTGCSTFFTGGGFIQSLYGGGKATFGFSAKCDNPLEQEECAVVATPRWLFFAGPWQPGVLAAGWPLAILLAPLGGVAGLAVGSALRSLPAAPVVRGRMPSTAPGAAGVSG
jgi:hypothetical protein